MNSLLKIFSKYYVLILFIFLQAIATIIIIQGKNYHRSLFINSVNSVTGNTYTAISNYRQYFKLREDNVLLAEENAKLLNITPTAVRKLNDRYLLIEDTLYKQRYVYRNAQVVSNSIDREDNFVVINLGKKDGVMEDMGIITPKGVIGIVVQVSDHYSKAISFLHSDSRVSCKIKRNDASGELHWMADNHLKAKVLDLPLTTRVYKGDTIITSGYSSIYPKGIILGIVENVSQNQSTQMLDVWVDLTQDFNALNHVFVVENLEKTELTLLREGENKND